LQDDDGDGDVGGTSGATRDAHKRRALHKRPSDCDEAFASLVGTVAPDRSQELEAPAFASVEMQTYRERADGRPSLDDMAAEIWEHLEKPDQVAIQQAWAKRDGRAIKIATMCSGTDAPVAGCSRVSRILNEQLDDDASPVVYHQLFSVEHNAKKRDFIAANAEYIGIRCEQFFHKVEQVARDGVAMEGLHVGQHTRKVVPNEFDIVYSSFSCKSASFENTRRDTSCIAKSSDETGVTFHCTAEVMKGGKLGVSENVLGLLQGGSGRGGLDDELSDEEEEQEALDVGSGIAASTGANLSLQDTLPGLY
jgi:hypothetical protein